MHRRAVLRAAGLGVAGTLAGCSLGGAPETRTVEMTDGLDFDPHTVTIAQGGTVTWENVGSIEHTVTADAESIPQEAAYFASGGFESEHAARVRLQDGLLGADDTYEHTFEEPGTYEYICLPHESSGMDGVVRVR